MTVDERHQAPWDWPECPSCETNVFVGGQHGAAAEYRCHFCGQLFNGSGRGV